MTTTQETTEETAKDPRPTVMDSIGDLTGFDEIAIEKYFHADYQALNNSMTLRALVFVQFRREGRDDKAAYGESMRLTLRAINERFSRPPAVEDDDQGKD